MLGVLWLRSSGKMLTRHSSAIALREHCSPEQIKQIKRLRIGADDIREIYEQSSGTRDTTPIKADMIKK